jgi:hypothetical protein
LKKIEKLLNNKSQKANYQRLQNVRKQSKGDTVASLQKKKESIHRFLSKHYVQRRSIVFVLDKSFSSVFYYERAIAFITKTFGELKENDYFGLITLESSMFKDSIVLE